LLWDKPNRSAPSVFKLQEKGRTWGERERERWGKRSRENRGMNQWICTFQTFTFQLNFQSGLLCIWQSPVWVMTRIIINWSMLTSCVLPELWLSDHATACLQGLICRWRPSQLRYSRTSGTLTYMYIGPVAPLLDLELISTGCHFGRKWGIFCSWVSSVYDTLCHLLYYCSCMYNWSCS